MFKNMRIVGPAIGRGAGNSLSRIGFGFMAMLGLGAGRLLAQDSDAGLRTEFRVKYVAAGAVYLDHGKNAGLEEGMNRQVRRRQTGAESKDSAPAPQGGVIAEIRVLSVALVSAVCEVVSSASEIKVGDVAFLGETEIEKATQQKELGTTRKYPQVVTFTEGDTLDEEARAYVPRPPLPEINRARGLIGFEYGGLSVGGPFGSNTSQVGLVLKADVTRIGGSYWGLSGYWRGRLDTQSGSGAIGARTLDELINRTYHMQLTYNNPNSHWVAGFGRLYLPWASSLDTIDGGYFGRRLGPSTTAGIFAGTTPDPTSWNYSPNRRIAGSFINFEGGSFESFRYTSTFGVGVSTLGWQADRQFIFTENGLFYKDVISIYHSLQADRPRIPNSAGVNLPNLTGVSRSFLTVRIQPVRRFSIDFSHNYFRDLPTFDPTLISTGLVDQLLFQGFSVGGRLDLPKTLSIYNSVGRSSGTGDARSSLNQMYGVTMGKIWKTGIRGDVKYSKFNSSFGRGNYSALSLSRSFRETLQCEFLMGKQNLVSSFTRNTSYRSLGGNVNWFPRLPVYFDGGFTRQHGTIQDYNQWYIGLGYRFDSLKQRGRAPEAK
jgi:hypothetical protein